MLRGAVNNIKNRSADGEKSSRLALDILGLRYFSGVVEYFSYLLN